MHHGQGGGQAGRKSREGVSQGPGFMYIKLINHRNISEHNRVEKEMRPRVTVEMGANS